MMHEFVLYSLCGIMIGKVPEILMWGLLARGVAEAREEGQN